MHNHLDFSYDHESFAELPDMIDDIHQHGQKFIVITVSKAPVQPYGMP